MEFRSRPAAALTTSSMDRLRVKEEGMGGSLSMDSLSAGPGSLRSVGSGAS